MNNLIEQFFNLDIIRQALPYLMSAVHPGADGRARTRRFRNRPWVCAHVRSRLAGPELDREYMG